MPYKDPQNIRAASERYRQTHHEKILASATNYRQTHRAQCRAATKRYRETLRLETFNHYGGTQCVCCGENRLEFLTLDHIAGDGAAQRGRLRRGGTSFYSILKKQNFPDGFRILCWNCNCSLGFFGYCPHGNVKIESDNAQDLQMRLT